MSQIALRDRLPTRMAIGATNLSQLPSRLTPLIGNAGSATVIAGHYCLADDMQELSHDGLEEASSFKFGARIVANMLAEGRHSRLILWINDIGIPATRRSAIKAAYRLPANYQSILDGEQLPRRDLVVCFESTMRNKASTLLRKIYKNSPDKLNKISSARADLVRCVGDRVCETQARGKMAYTIDGPDGEQLVVKDGPNPKCNLILAALFRDLAAKYRPHVHINIFNELYSYRVGLGVHVFRTLLENQTPIVNIFCDGSRYLLQDNHDTVDLAMDCGTQIGC